MHFEHTTKNVANSSGWIEYFADGENAPFFEEPIQGVESLLVPSISIYEVFERLLREPEGESIGLEVVAAMQRGAVVDLSPELALEAARIAQENRLPTASSVVLATSRSHDATVWTQDPNFEGWPAVKYMHKQ